MSERCGSCKAEIRWALTSSERPIPLDAEPHPDGNIHVTAGHAYVIPVAARGAFPGQLYRAHFATCPYARNHRKRGGA